MESIVRNKVARYLLSLAGVAAATALLMPFRGHVNQTTVALALLLVVLFVATLWGSRPAMLAAVFGMLSFNFFFLPPTGTLTIADPENWVALAAFLVVAVTAGQLSASARRRAEEAEAGRREIGRLYDELRDAFGRASHAEALRQSEKLKTALLDAVTHDMRTPLTSIKASVTTLLDGSRAEGSRPRPFALDEEARQEMLEVIDEECDRLTRFVEGLLELARIEAGELRLRQRWGVVEEIVGSARERARPLTRGRRVDAEIEEELPVIRVDPKAVAEVVYTLIDNAAKYSPAGTRVRVAARRAGDDMIGIEVEDEGPGVPPHLRERVFDKFFRAMRDGDISTRHPRGTGMGLAIAKGIVEAHGGRIWIEAGANGKGARVMFTLPVGDEEAAEQNLRERESEPAGETSRRAAPPGANEQG